MNHRRGPVVADLRRHSILTQIRVVARLMHMPARMPTPVSRSCMSNNLPDHATVVHYSIVHYSLLPCRHTISSSMTPPSPNARTHVYPSRNKNCYSASTVTWHNCWWAFSFAAVSPQFRCSSGSGSGSLLAGQFEVERVIFSRCRW